MSSRYNPVRALLLFVGGLLARAGLAERERIARATDLSWPRIVTGLARMSKSTADVAMVGLAIGPTAIAGVGFASPFWGLAFALGGGVAGGTIGMVSQRFGADAREELGLTVTTSAAVVLAITLPVTAAYWLYPGFLVELVGSGDAAVGYGERYLKVVSIGVPFAALNLVGSRTLVGADDAYAPMLVRGGGAVVNVVFNATLIFGLGMGVVGAAVGTVVANVLVTAAFAVGLARGGLPGVEFPVQIPLSRPFLDASLARDLASMGTPLVGTNLARTGAQFPRLFIVGLFGPTVVSAYVVALRVRMLLDTPNWGLSLASSSLVGQALGEDDEREATEWARTVLRLGIGVYVLVAAALTPFSRQISRLFVDDPAVIGLVTVFVAVACVSVVFRGVDGGATGPLRASGDTNWPLYSQLAGMYLFALPVAYVGVLVPAIGLFALYASLLVETAVPAAITYYRFDSGTWRVVSRAYRPDAALDD
ncbi:MATE family efflux transporter [Haloarcula sp. JP-L23]|uniref:MATE family efflux transporter n=1 Tax=Haloarcula sp. JP-L23 TaxID=2716717 RepID=UPI00140EFCB7|nr:MATE family efflux transporter [Haloarcula sp. JP-L23]